MLRQVFATVHNPIPMMPADDRSNSACAIQMAAVPTQLEIVAGTAKVEKMLRSIQQAFVVIRTWNSRQVAATWNELKLHVIAAATGSAITAPSSPPNVVRATELHRNDIPCTIWTLASRP
jgi:hypothetical protein